MRRPQIKPSRLVVVWGGDRRLSGRTDGVRVGSQATGQRSPTKAFAKCARSCHLTATPAPTPCEPLFTADRGGARAENPALERPSPGSRGGRGCGRSAGRVPA